ncbi:MAG TPA: FHA domain-containing protein [Gemmatimonadaceae bacterium]
MPPTRVNMSGAMRTATCGWCGNPVDPGLPFCAHCGRRTDAVLSKAASCTSCGASVLESDTFCGACGTPTAAPATRASDPEVRTLVFSAKRHEAGVRLAVLNAQGEVKQTVVLTRSETIVGRGACDLSFADDLFLSPLHAQFVVRDGALFVRDLGSCNRTWVFIDTPFTLGDEETLLIGSQVCQVRRVGSPASPANEADGTRRMGSVSPGTDVALISQLRGDGSVRDVHYLAAGRALAVGRDTGDWTFPYDQTMSARHAEFRDEDGRLVIRDLGSRNGVALAVRGERQLATGQRVLVGDQVLRVESL